MSAKTKEKSLLELSIEYLNEQPGPQKITTIGEAVMQLKGYKASQAKEALPQFYCDFMESGNFVYVGDEQWDLKERQATSLLDKDGTDYTSVEDDEEAKKNELHDDDDDYQQSHDNDDADDESESNEDDDDIAAATNSDEIQSDEDVEMGYEEVDDEEE